MRFAKWWPEFLTFGMVFAVLMVDLNPDFTFINKAADSIGYIYSAQYLYPSYHTSPPLYLLTSHLFLMLPYGTEAWRMGLLSLLSTMGACVCIYLALIKLLWQKQNAKYFALMGVLIFGLSALVISQSIIVNTYATTTMLAVGAYYFYLRKQWKLMGLMIGIGLAVHLLMAFFFVIFIIGVREYRRNWKALAITLVFVLFYLYLPLTNRPPYMWLPDPEKVSTLRATFSDTLSTISMLIGSISIWDLPKRVFDIFGILGVSIAGIGMVPIVAYFRKTKFYKNILFWLMFIPVFIFLGELDMNTFDYMMPAMPFIAIIAVLGLVRLNIKALSYATACLIIGMGIFNANYFDIGRTLDKNLSATQLYRVEFDKIPDGAIFMPTWAWEWEAVFKYNKDTGKHIYPICIDILPSSLYRQRLTEDGIRFAESADTNVSIQEKEMARSIILLNDNVWTTRTTESSTFGSEVVPANDVTAIALPDKVKLQAIQENPQIQWKPYNPYDIMTTSIYETEWGNILLSNHNLLFELSLASIGLIIYWLLFIMPFSKNRGVKYEYTNPKDTNKSD